MKATSSGAIGSMAVIAAIACNESAMAAVRHVPAQYRTIQAAVNASVNGDIVHIADGTYTGLGNRDINPLGKAITIQGTGPTTTVIDVQGDHENQHTGFVMNSGETHTTVIRNLTITHGYMFNGPAMLLNNAGPTVRNVTMKDNHANCWGGAVYFESFQGGASPSFHNCRFLDNYSTDDGGAVFGFSGDAEFRECVFAGNEAPSAGGAILIWTSGNGQPRIVNCTIVNNAANMGAAIYSDNMQITNSIISGNVGGEVIWNPIGFGTVTVKHSLVQGGFAGEGNINATPVFVDATASDFHLMPGSAGIDGGDPATITPQGTLDLDGDPRSFGSAIDMGIDEFRKAGDADGDHLVDINDLLLVINTWGPCSWSTADFNGDFRVDIDDLLRVINGWGA